MRNIASFDKESDVDITQRAILQHSKTVQQLLDKHEHASNVVSMEMLPALKHQTAYVNKEGEKMIKSLMTSTTQGLSEFVSLAISGNLVPDIDSKFTKAVEDLKTILNKVKSNENSSPKSTGETYSLEEAVKEVNQLPLPRLVSWSGYENAYYTSDSYKLLTKHKQRMEALAIHGGNGSFGLTEKTVDCNSPSSSVVRPPIVYGNETQLLYFMMKNNGLKNSGHGIGSFARQKRAKPTDLNLAPDLRSNLLFLQKQNRDYDTVTPTFVSMLNRTLFLASCLTHFIEPEPRFHYSDLYMGIWYVVAFYLVTHTGVDMEYIMKQNFETIVKTYLVPALAAYFKESRRKAESPIGYTSLFGTNEQNADTSLVTPVDHDKVIKDMGGVVTSSELSDVDGSSGITSGNSPYIISDTENDQNFPLVIEGRYKNADYTPYITWLTAYPKSMYENSYMAKYLYETVFYHKNLKQHDTTSDSVFDQVVMEGRNADAAQHCRGLFYVILAHEEMRRIALLGINLLTLLYLLLSEKTVLGRPGENQFEHYVIPYLIKLGPTAPYTSSGAAFPGLWSLLTMVDRKLGIECASSGCEGAPTSYRPVFQVYNQKSMEQSFNTGLVYSNIPTSMMWLIELINCIISQRKKVLSLESSMTSEQKLKLEQMEQRTKLMRNIVLQEVEKNINAIFHNATFSHVVKTHLINMTYGHDIFIKPLTTSVNLSSTDLWDYLKQGFRFKEKFDLIQ